MTDRTITADYVGLKYMPKKMCWQLVFEVDERMGQAIIERIGLPSSGESKPCLIAAAMPNV